MNALFEAKTMVLTLSPEEVEELEVAMLDLANGQRIFADMEQRLIYASIAGKIEDARRSETS